MSKIAPIQDMAIIMKIENNERWFVEAYDPVGNTINWVTHRLSAFVFPNFDAAQSLCDLVLDLQARNIRIVRWNP